MRSVQGGLIALIATSLMLIAIASASAAPLIPEMQTHPLPTGRGDPQIVDGPGGVKQVAFSNGWENHGAGPWETAPRAGAETDDCDGDGNPSNDAFVDQRIYDDAHGNGTFERSVDTHYTSYPAGCMIFHPQHNHFHIENAGEYSLFDEATGQEVGTSTKVSFCLLDVSPFDISLPGSPANAYYTTCNPTVQGISVGWYDLYGWYLAGQQIDLDPQLGEGDYCLRSQFDPLNIFVEQDETNNLAERRYHINPSTDSISALSGACQLGQPPPPPPPPGGGGGPATPLDTAITSGPEDGSVLPERTPTFAFSSSGDAHGFECSLDAGPFAQCSSPYTTDPLDDGAHKFAVRATGPGAPDESPAARVFTVDTTAPDTLIASGPAGKTANASPSFSFGAGEEATFECRLDARRWKPCTSPRGYRDLRNGPHRFRVRATDLAGNAEDDPARRRFTVVG